MGRLTEIDLSHFRSHRRTRLEITSPVVAIHGPNGAGKTNLLEAVSLLSPGRGMRRASAEEIIRKPEAVGWRIKAQLEASGTLHEVELRAEPGQSRSTRIDGKASPQVALGRLMQVIWLVPSMDRLWIEGAEGRRRFLDRAALSFFPDHAEASLTYDKAMRDRNRLLKEGVRDPHWYDALEAQMAKAGAVITAHRQKTVTLLMDGQTADSAFPTAQIALTHSDPTPSDEDDLQQALAASRPRDMAAGRSLIGPHRADLQAEYQEKGMAARLCSTGEQKALLLSLVLANARTHRMYGSEPTLLLDEVAAHLDHDRRAALYAEVERIGGQAFLTGTGSELFVGLTAAQNLCVTAEGGESRLEAG